MTVRNLDDHEPGGRDSDGHLRCVADGFRWPCPEVRAAGASLTPNEEAVLELVEPGWQVWARQPSPDVAPVGGLVLGWKDEVGGAGDDYSATRVFRILGWKNGRHQFTRLGLGELDPGLSQLPELRTIRTFWRALCREVAAGKGLDDSEEFELVATAFTLTRMAGQPADVLARIAG